MKSSLTNATLVLAVLGVGCIGSRPNDTVDVVEAIVPPAVIVRLEVRRDAVPRPGIQVTFRNSDRRFAACLDHSGMPVSEDLDHFFDVYSPSGVPMTSIVEQTGTMTFFPTVIYVRPQRELQSFVDIEKSFPGALTPGTCITFRVDFMNCRALEVADFYLAEGGRLQPGRGSSQSSWQISEHGELRELPDSQECRPPPSPR